MQIGGWLLLVPLFSGMALIVYSDLTTALTIGFLRQAIGFGLTLGLWRIYRRWPAASFQLARHAWKIILWCLLAVAIDVMVADLARRALPLAAPPPLVQYGAIVVRLAVYVAWSALYFVIRQELESRANELRLAQAESANREAELQQLRAQVHPHFVFNALNNIIGEAETSPAAVIDTAHAVADYLRYSLSQRGHHARLGDELHAMANYLHVERSHRGRDRLDWRIDASDGARAAVAPTALIQPLVENAIKYGIRSSPLPLRLTITARTHDGTLVVAVENTGAWIEHPAGDKPRSSTGIGLANLRRRLELLYGDGARLEIATPAGSVRVEVTLPLTTESAPA